MIRVATRADFPAIVTLINQAFVVEAFFKIGDRTTAAEVAGLVAQGGEFLVEEEGRTLVGCVYLTCDGDHAYFGMLSIDPESQGRGHGRRLIDAVEARARARGCRFVDIHVVNLREELPPYYARLGYVRSGELPFSDPELASSPCHFIVMTKSLTA